MPTAAIITVDGPGAFLDESRHFGDALVQRTRSLGHPLCVGLDPHLERIPPLFRRGQMALSSPLTAVAVEDFLATVIDRVADRVAIVKPQIAFFEQLGWQGIRVLHALVRRATRRGLLVLLDAKRGDIGSTAEGYARAYLDHDSLLPVDAVTLNPYLGPDTLEPFLDRAKTQGRGLFVLVKTSNPGSGALQDEPLQDAQRAEAPVYERVAEWLAEPAEALRGPETGWSALGVVVGAPYPGPAERIRARLPHSLFLVPGYGAQGASVEDALRGFVRGPNGLEGGVVASSRAVLYPSAGEVDSAAIWERAFDESLTATIDSLKKAVSQS